MRKAILTLLLLLCFFTLHAGEITLVEAGKSKIRIVTPADATQIEKEAAGVFQDYIEKISGARLRIVPDRKRARKSEILIGGVNRPELNNIDKESLEEDGFIILTTDSKLIICGGTEKGVLYGVYTFLEKYLGCRKYSSTVNHIPRLESITLEPINDMQVPWFRYREVYYSDVFDRDFSDWHKLDSHGERGAKREWGYWCHSFASLVPVEDHGQSHPEYYGYFEGKRHPGSQLCLTNPEVFSIVLQNLKREIEDNPGPLYWSVSQDDHQRYCRCPECARADKEAESHMGSLLPFINKLGLEFPDKIISTLAYQYTRKPPINITPGKNVNIMLCNIESPRHITLEQGDPAFCRDLQGWGDLTDNILLWDYVIQFSNLLAPFPNLRTLQPNVQYFRDNNVRALFEQGNRDIGGEFAELRAYLLTKLVWDPDIDANAVMDDFLSGYYGKAGEIIREYIDLLHDEMVKSGASLSIFGKPFQAKETFLSDSLVAIYNQIFDNAEKAVSDTPDILSRVKSARLPVQYSMLEIAREELTGKRGAFKANHRGYLQPDPSMVDVLHQFSKQCILTGVSRVTEWHTTPKEYLREYARFLEEHSGKPATFAGHWEFVGVAVSDPGYHVWGCSPIEGPDGKVHLYGARWPEKYNVDPGWRSHSEIAHYIADKPEGPFIFSEVALTGTGTDTWDRCGVHNPTIHRVDDQFILLYTANNNPEQPPHPANQAIGMAVSESLYGPWHRVGTDGKILEPPQNPSYWNHNASNGVNNPALLQHPDGGFYLYFKSEKAMMGLAVAEQITGPYVQLPFPVTNNKKRVEDGYAFMLDGEFCMLTTDNHGLIQKGGGILWKSADGIQFTDMEAGFFTVDRYLDKEKLRNHTRHYGAGPIKFERPQLLIMEGVPRYLYVPSGCNLFGGDCTENYVLKYKE